MQGRVLGDYETKKRKNLNTILKDYLEWCESAMQDSLETLGFICFIEKGKEQAYENARMAEITKKHSEKAKENENMMALMFQSKQVARRFGHGSSEASAEILKFKSSTRYVDSKRIPHVLVLQNQNTDALNKLYLERIINICLIRTDLILLKNEVADRANISNSDFNDFLDKAQIQIKLLQEREAALLRSNKLFSGFPPSHCIAICNTELTKVRDNQARFALQRPV